MRHFALKEMQKNMRMRVAKLEKKSYKNKSKETLSNKDANLDMHEWNDRENDAANFVGKSSNIPYFRE